MEVTQEMIEDVGKAEEFIQKLLNERKSLEAGKMFMSVYKEMMVSYVVLKEEVEVLKGVVEEKEEKVKSLEGMYEKERGVIDSDVERYKEERVKKYEEYVSGVEEEEKVLAVLLKEKREEMMVERKGYEELVQRYDVEIGRLQEKLVSVKKEYEDMMMVVDRVSKAAAL